MVSTSCFERHMDLPERFVLLIWLLLEGLWTEWANSCPSPDRSSTSLLGVLCKRPSIRFSNDGVFALPPSGQRLWLPLGKEKQQVCLTSRAWICIWTQLLTEQHEVWSFPPPCSQQFGQNPSNQPWTQIWNPSRLGLWAVMRQQKFKSFELLPSLLQVWLAASVLSFLCPSLLEINMAFFDSEVRQVWKTQWWSW